MKTKERIIHKARAMFNENGIEYVGLRELASILNMRVSNITYYFPTKDDLVNQLSLNLNQLNSEVVVDYKNLSMHSFLEVLKKVFGNHIKYRCLLLSFVHLMEQNKVISARYKKTEKYRNATLKSNLNVLQRTGYLNIADQNEIDFLVSTIALMVRFWISEAAVSYRNLSVEAQMNHYLTLLARFLSPYATGKGESDIQRFLENLN